MSETKNSAQDRVNELFEELVPPMGQADTVAGEIIRATCRIGYRLLNDGDCIGIGYGNETCNSAARYLGTTSSMEVAHFIYEEMWGKEYEEDTVDELCRLVVEDIDNRPELLTRKNDLDMLDFFDPVEDVAYLEEDEDEWCEW